jgi:hypothetical protein
MPVPFAPWTSDVDQDEDEEPRGPRFFDPSLNHSEAWPPPRPPKGEMGDDSALVDQENEGRLADYQ